jgi:MarR family 2-MHQ and catechol resistance regulon transcriptional repressor
VSERAETGIHLWLVLMKAHRAMAELSMHSIANTGMCFSDFAILEALLHKGSLPVNSIAPMVNLTSGSMTTAVDRLEGRNLVRRAGDPKDRRARVVHLTPQGRLLIERVFARHSADMEAAAAVLSPSERDTLLLLLKKIGKAAVNSSTTGKNSNNEQTVSHNG